MLIRPPGSAPENCVNFGSEAKINRGAADLPATFPALMPTITWGLLSLSIKSLTG